MSTAITMQTIARCESEASQIRVNAIKGEASVIRADQTLPIKAGDTLQQGDLIRTASSGTVDLVVNNVAGYRALPDSESSILNADPKDTSLGVSKGKIVINLSKLSKDSSFQVKTPTAIAAVRGTQFSCAANPGDAGSSFAVREGSVEVQTLSTGQSVMLNEGFALDVPLDFSGSLNPREAQGMELATLDQASSIKTCS
jgi:hypothetical protein